MAYTWQTHARYQDARYDYASNRLTYTVLHPETGLEATASAVTIAVYAPGETTATLSATAMSAVAGSDSQWEYTLDTTETSDYPVDVGYRAEVVYTISSVEYYDQFFVSVVYYPLIFGLSDDQLYELESELERVLPTGQTTWIRKIRAAENQIRAEFYEASTQNENLHPSRVNGYAQIFEWHRYKTLWLVFSDLEDAHDEGSKTLMYEERMKTAKEACLSQLAYSVSEEEAPDADDEINAGGTFLTR